MTSGTPASACRISSMASSAAEKPNFRVAARAEPARDLAAHLDFLHGDRPRQRLHVRVAGHEVHVDRTFEHQAVQRVRPGTPTPITLMRKSGSAACEP